MTLHQAISKVLEMVNEDLTEEEMYIVDERQIIETNVAWYIPFCKKYPIGRNEIRAGVTNGYIIGKSKGDMYQLGSLYPIKKWLQAYELGVLGWPYNFIITKVYDETSAAVLLEKLEMKYFISYSTIHKFTKEMISKRLKQLPCVFKNQSFFGKIDVFQEMKDKKIIEWELNRIEKVMGETGERIYPK